MSNEYTYKRKKIGHIVKLAEEGYFYKSIEGELIRGGLTDGSGSFGKSFHFVIENCAVYQKAKYALENNKEVIMEYHCEFMSSPFRSQYQQPNFCDDIKFNE